MPNEVEQIKSRLDIVDVVGEYVRLKQSGQNWKGNCPFHHEKTPSFMAHREKQIWHCFGCGEGGDIFSFIQKIENIDFPEALEILARKAQVPLAPRGAKAGESDRRLKLFQAAELANAFYQDQLKNSPLAAKVRDYLKTRQITTDSMATFGLGYSLLEWDKLLVYLRGKSFSMDEIIAAGLALKSDRGPGAYDRFRDRLMFPINDTQGRVVGFGGRTLNAEAKEAKYINSPQGPIYNKSLILYNLDKAKNFIKEQGYAVLVEGYMDVIGSWQADVKNVVATSGTALTPEQVILLKRYTNEIRFIFDDDVAGKNAADKGTDFMSEVIRRVESLTGEKMIVKRVTLPFGKDPDECAKKDPNALRKAIDEALLIGDYILQEVKIKFNLKTLEGKKQARDHFLNFISHFPDPLDKDHYIKLFSKECDYDERSLREELANVKTKPISERVIGMFPSQLVKQPIGDRHQLLSDRFVSLILRYAEDLAGYLDKIKPEMVVEGSARELYRRMVIYYNDSQSLGFEELKAELIAETELSNLLDKLFLQAERDFSDFGTTEAHSEASKLLHQLKHHYLTMELKRLSVAIGEAEKAGKNNELQELLGRFTEVSRELTSLQI
jgi:DNA primase